MAGFEPAVYALGGRRIIQAMLHAQLALSSPRFNGSMGPLGTWIAAPISAGGVSTVSDALPDPYGRGFDAGEDTVARVRSAWERREQSRLSAGSLARRPWQSVLRTSLGPTVLLIAVLRLIAPNLGSSGALLIIYLMIHSVAHRTEPHRNRDVIPGPRGSPIASGGRRHPSTPTS